MPTFPADDPDRGPLARGDAMTAIRWGVIGTGDISHRIVPDLTAVAGQPPTAVWGRHEDRAADFADRHRIARWSTDLDAALRGDDVDAVYVATPIGTHSDIASRALEAGKHVLVEKPMASTADEISLLFDKAISAGRLLMEAMWMKFNPLHTALISQVDGGVIGEPRSVRAGFGTPFPPGGSRWDAELGGSTVLDQGIYGVTLAQWVLGEPRAIRASGRVRRGVDVHAVVELDFDDGRFAQLGVSAVEFIDPSASISGTAGWATIDRMFWASRTASLYDLGIPSLFTPPRVLEFDEPGNGFRPMLRAFDEAVRAGLVEHPRHGRAETVSVARTLDEIRRQVLHERAPRIGGWEGSR